MNGDLRLFRKRWWGSWAIGATALLALCFLVPMVFEPNTSPKGIHAGGAAVMSGLMIALVFCCYAPWSFFWLVRVLALLGFALGVWYAVDEARRGRYVTDPGQEHSLLHALGYMLYWGLPCLWIALMRRPRACPYDERGRSRPFEMQRTFRVLALEPAAHDSEAAGRNARQVVKFDYAGLCGLEVLDPRVPPLLRATLPLDETGVAVWNDWERRLREAGLRCEIVGEEPGRRSFVNAVLASVKDRWTQGRRVPVPGRERSGSAVGPTRSRPETRSPRAGSVRTAAVGDQWEGLE